MYELLLGLGVDEKFLVTNRFFSVKASFQQQPFGIDSFALTLSSGSRIVDAGDMYSPGLEPNRREPG